MDGISYDMYFTSKAGWGLRLLRSLVKNEVLMTIFEYYSNNVSVLYPKPERLVAGGYRDFASLKGETAAAFHIPCYVLAIVDVLFVNFMVSCLHRWCRHEGRRPCQRFVLPLAFLRRCLLFEHFVWLSLTLLLFVISNIVTSARTRHWREWRGAY